MRISDIYGIVKQCRQRIIETMQERGLTKVEIIPSREDYEKEHKDDPDYDEFGWDDLKNYTCPAITYYNKHSMGLSYDVISVELDMNDGNPRFKLNCEGEYDNDWFYDYDVCSMLDVYEAMERELGLDVDEPEKVWVVTFINDPDCEIPNVSVNVFGNYDEARKCLDEEWQTLTTEVMVGYDEDVSKKKDDDFFFVDNRENRVIGEIKERKIENE